MLELFAVLQVAHIQPNVSFQQDDVPLHWGLSKQMDWAGQTNPMFPLLHRYNHITLFFRPGIPSKGVVELRARINNAFASVLPQMLENTWREMEYR
jgi:hypothetical protein